MALRGLVKDYWVDMNSDYTIILTVGNCIIDAMLWTVVPVTLGN